MSDTNRVRVAAILETEYGVSPGGNFTELPIASETLGFNTSRTPSKRIISSRQRQAAKRTSIDAAGNIGGELAAQQWDALIAGALQTTWPVAEVTITGTDISAAAADNSFNDVSAGFVTAGFVPGQVIKVSGFATAANNGFFTAKTVAAGKIVVEGGTLVLEAATPSVTIKGTPIVIGTTLQSFAIEKQWLDLTTPSYWMFLGMVVNQMVFGTTPDNIVSCGFDFLGKTANAPSTTSGAGTVVDAAVEEAFGPVDEIKWIAEGGVEVTEGVTDLGLTVANNARAKKALMTLGAFKTGLGSAAVSGTFAQHFESIATLTKVVNNTATKLAWAYEGPSGKGLGIALPYVHLDGSPGTPGPDGDVIASMSYSASNDDADSGETIVITRW